MRNRCHLVKIGSLSNIGSVFAQTPFGLTTTKVNTENALYPLKSAQNNPVSQRGIIGGYIINNNNDKKKGEKDNEL